MDAFIDIAIHNRPDLLGYIRTDRGKQCKDCRHTFMKGIDRRKPRLTGIVKISPPLDHLNVMSCKNIPSEFSDSVRRNKEVKIRISLLAFLNEYLQFSQQPHVTRS